MHFTKLLSCNFVSDGYNGMNIQTDIKLEEKKTVIPVHRSLELLHLYVVGLRGPT